MAALRTGVFIPQGWRFDLVGIEPSEQWRVMRDLAVRADAGPWESVWVYDHFHTTPRASQEATHEAWTLMAALAAATHRVRLGQMCTCMSYRNPAYLAKVAATCDIVSGGRIEMGIGGGWYENEWRAYGYGFPGIGTRLARLREGVDIMKQAWTTGTATLHGAHYDVDGAIVRPLPLQPGGIPIWVAGGGEKVTLRIAAELGDYTNFDGTLDAFRHKSAVLAEHCRATGRDFETITRSANYNVAVGSSEAEVADRLAQLADRLSQHVGHDAVAKQLERFRGKSAVGTPEQIVERFTALRAAGLRYAIFYFPEAGYDTSGIELFEREVLPELQ
jgi:F420-dependent oxidoreductase-like protein